MHRKDNYYKDNVRTRNASEGERAIIAQGKKCKGEVTLVGQGKNNCKGERTKETEEANVKEKVLRRKGQL